ncbi:MAG: methionine adenosyltransferase [Candidatus Bathyarchaeia archaeon]|nr:methionine adenosyltransferase [Candidatus Bathyarchaeota archaeon]
MRNIFVNTLKQTPVRDQPIEICERKGIGHPDTICDLILNDISVALSKEYLKRFGRIMHYNIDKGLLVAGEVERKFGGGRVLKPMLLVIGDRATFQVDDAEVPIEEIARETAKRWFRENMRFVDPEEHVRYQVEIKRGSEALRDIFERGPGRLPSNDTSAAVGFYPLTETEITVLELERYLNSDEFKRDHPETGEDVKVMGVRRRNDLHLTVAMAFVDKYVKSEEDYFRKKGEVLEEILSFISPRTDMESVTVDLNTLDEKGRDMRGIYLTVLGTSADDGDCGQVGRGNRANGIIPLNRPASSEAAAGKNPVSHVGKIYNLLSYRLAREIYERVPGISEAYVWLVSQIGRPIDQPMIASAELILEKNTSLKEVSREVHDIIDAKLESIDEFCMELIEGKIPVC